LLISQLLQQLDRIAGLVSQVVGRRHGYHHSAKESVSYA
jgi:hypothetical protein